MILFSLLTFAAVFLIIYSLTGSLFKPQVDVNKRMSTYIDTVTASLNLQKIATDQMASTQTETTNQFREIFKKYGKKIEERGYTKKIELELQKGDLPLRGYEFIFLIFATTIGGVLLLSVVNHNLISMVVAGIVGFLGPLVFLRIKQQKKVTRFNAQIGDALILISNSLKAGYGFMQAMDLVAKEMSPPIQTEFARTMQEINLGTTTEEALLHLPERVNSADLDLVVTAMLIQRQIGGNLSEILDNISQTIRERLRIKGEIKALTAQGRLSGFIIGGLPVCIGLFLLLINPKYVTQLFTDVRGQYMVGYAVIAELIAILIIRKIVNIKI